MFNEGSATLEAELQESKKPAPLPAPTFLMPTVDVGDIILWRSEPKATDEVPALVVRAGDDAIAVQVFIPDMEKSWPRDGVRHLTDPRWTAESGDGGVWRHRYATALSMDLIDQLNALLMAQQKVLHGLVERVKALEGAA